MKEYHLYLLCALIFNLSAIILAFSNAALMAVFIVLGGTCTTLSILSIRKEKQDE